MIVPCWSECLRCAGGEGEWYWGLFRFFGLLVPFWDNIEQVQEDWKFQMDMELIDVRAELLYLKSVLDANHQ